LGGTQTLLNQPETPMPAALPIDQAALFVIDAQDSFLLGPRWQQRSNPQFEANLAALVEAFRAAGRPVVFFLHTDGDPGFTPDSPERRLMDFLAPRPDEPVFVKDTRNAFTSTGVGAWLAARGVRRIAVTGISTEQCCETTTRVAADLGYDVDYVTEATVTFPIPHPDRPEEVLPVEAIIERTEYVLRGRFARIATVDGLRAELEAYAAVCSG
jgi:nicotinamidase-related amidase